MTIGKSETNRCEERQCQAEATGLRPPCLLSPAVTFQRLWNHSFSSLKPGASVSRCLRSYWKRESTQAKTGQRHAWVCGREGKTNFFSPQLRLVTGRLPIAMMTSWLFEWLARSVNSDLQLVVPTANFKEIRVANEGPILSKGLTT